MAVPRPRVVCPSCSQIHEQQSGSAVCKECNRPEEDRRVRQLRLGGRSGVSARGDLNAVFRDPRGPFAQGFRVAFFRDDPLEAGGFPEFSRKLTDLYAERLADADARTQMLRTEYERCLREAGEYAERRYQDGYDAGVAEGNPAIDAPLLRDVVRLTHPDMHPIERADLANRVTAAVLMTLERIRESAR